MVGSCLDNCINCWLETNAIFFGFLQIVDLVPNMSPTGLDNNFSNFLLYTLGYQIIHNVHVGLRNKEKMLISFWGK